MAGERVIKVQKAPRQQPTIEPFSAVELLEEFCFLYPRYSLEEARRLPYFRVCRLVRSARKRRAQQLFELTQIVAAPHTTGGDLYKELTEHYRSLANG